MAKRRMLYGGIVKNVVYSMLLLTGCFSVAKCCPRPELPKNGYLKDGQEVYDVGSSVTLLCKEGFAPTGRSFAKCLNDGSWDSPLPSCEKDVLFKKPIKIQIWDNVTNDFTNDSDTTLTGGQISPCLQLISGHDNYLEIDLKDMFYISQILMTFGKPGMQVDLEIRIVDTSDYSEERKQCGKISEKLELRGIIVLCKRDESNKTKGLKGNKLQIYFPMPNESVSICKIQAINIGQVEIAADDPNESDKSGTHYFQENYSPISPSPDTHSKNSGNPILNDIIVQRWDFVPLFFLFRLLLP